MFFLSGKKKGRTFTSIVLTILLITNNLCFSVGFSQAAPAAANPKAETGKKDDKKPVPGKDFEPGRLIVKFKAGANKNAVTKKIKGSVLKNLGMKNTQLVQVDKEADILQTVAALQKDPNVEYAEPNYIYRAKAVPNDPSYPQQWALPKMKVPEAWDIATASSSVKIAIIDSGVDMDHPDLAAALEPGYDFIAPGTTPDDEYGHGTHVAGIAAAIANNTEGVASVASGARIMPIRTLNADGEGTLGNFANAIKWAADNGANIINLSVGSMNSSQTMEDAIDYAYGKGAVIVAAAGNEADMYYYGNPVEYPAANNHVIAVGATGSSDIRASFSSFGNHLDLTAPGVGILSTMPNHAFALESEGCVKNYDSLDGTSMATPQVAGLAALVLSRYPNLTPYQVEMILKLTADDLGSTAGWDAYYGYGRVNALNAISYAADGLPSDIFEPNNSLETAKTVPSASPVEGTFASAEDADWFKITVSTTRIQVNLNVPAAADGRLDVYNASGQLVTTINSFGTGIKETATMQVTPGDYFCKVSNVNGFSGTATYALKVIDDYEPNDSTATAAPIDLNTTIQAVISPAGDLDYYKITVPATGIFKVTLSSNYAMDGVLYIYNSLGQAISFTDNGYEGDTETTTIQLNSGVYYIRVEDYYEWSFSYKYSLSVTDKTPPTGSMTINNGAQYTKSTAVTLNLNVTDNVGVDKMQFSHDGITWLAWENYATTKSWTLSSTQGTKTVYARVKDKGENFLTLSDTITLDSITPVVQLNSPSGITADNTPLLEYTVSEGAAAVKVDGVVVAKTSGDSLDPLSEGSHTVRVDSSDPAGNTGFDEKTVFVDTSAPDIVFNTSGFVNSSNVDAYSISGTTEAGSTVNVTFSDGINEVAVEAAEDNGTWTAAADLSDLTDGPITVTATAQDNAGNMATPEETQIYKDTVLPTFTASSSKSLTKDTTTIDITASKPLNALPLVLVNGKIVTVLPDGENRWSGTWTRQDGDLDGIYTISVNGTDLYGNVGNQILNNTNSFTLDTTAPVVQIISPAGTTKDATPLLDYTVSDGTITVLVDGQSVAKTSGDSLDTLSEGSHTVKVEAIDEAGNIGFDEKTVVVDSSAPDIVFNTTSFVNSSNAGAYSISGTTEAGSTLDVTFTDGTREVTVEAVEDEGTWTALANLSLLANGWITVSAIAQDAAGNIGMPEETQIYKDTVLPTFTATSLKSLTKDATTINIIASKPLATLPLVLVNGRIVTVLPDGEYSWSGIWTKEAGDLDGLYTISVNGTDLYGNVGSQILNGTNNFTLDATAPVVSLNAPSGMTMDATPLLDYTVSDGTVTVLVDGQSVSKISGDSLDALTEGSHTVRVEATDQAGNTGFDEKTVFVDTAAPEGQVTINDGDEWTKNDTVKLTVTGTDNSGPLTMQFSNNGLDWTDPEGLSGEKDWNLADGDGAKTVYLKLTDPAGNATVVSDSINLDTSQPELNANPQAINAGVVSSYALSGTAENGATVSATLTDSTGHTIIAGPVLAGEIWAMTGINAELLKDGNIDISVTANDLAGNTQTVHYQVLKDIAIPQLTASVSKTLTNNETVITIRSDEALSGTPLVLAGGTAVIISHIDGNQWSGTWSGEGKPDGEYQVTMSGWDLAGNLFNSTANGGSISFTYDVTPPASPAFNSCGFINNGNKTGFTVSGATEADSTVNVTFSDGSREVTVEATVTSGTWTAQANLSLLAEGWITVSAITQDAAGNIGMPEETQIYKETVLPAFTATSTKSITKDTARIIVTASEPLNNLPLVKVNGRIVPVLPDGDNRWSGTWTKQAGDIDGLYTISVSGTDFYGNTGSQLLNNTNKFTLDTVAPAVDYSTTPTYINISNKSSITITGTAEAYASISLKLTGSLGGVVTCPVVKAGSNGSFTITANPSSIKDGIVTFALTATDAAGNNSAPKTRTITKDTLAPSLASYSVPTYSTDKSATETFPLSWTGTDPGPSSGIVYDIAYHKDGVSTWTDYKSGYGGTQTSFAGAAGNTYYFRIRAKDKAGNLGNWTYPSTIVPYDNGSRISTNSGFTAISGSTSNYKGTLHYSNKANNSITYSFNGKKVGLIMLCGPGRAQAKIYIDGTLVRTVETNSDTYKSRKPVFAYSWSTAGNHTIKIVNVGNAGRPRLDIDALAVGR